MLPGHLILALKAELDVAATDDEREHLVSAFRDLETVRDATSYFEHGLTEIEPSLAE